MKLLLLIALGSTLNANEGSLLSASVEHSKATSVAPSDGADRAATVTSTPAGRSHAWADFNEDELPDLLALRPGGTLALLRNAGDGEFEDARSTLGLESGLTFAGAQWIDFDADGRVDVFAWNTAGRPYLLQNDGGASFADVTELAGWKTIHVTSAEWVDFDSDGRVDVVLTTPSGPALFHATGDIAFERVGLFLDSAAPQTAPRVTMIAPAAPNAADSTTTVASDEPAGAPALATSKRRTSLSARTPLTTASPTPDVSSVGLPMTASLGRLCAESIKDASTGGCLSASSVPNLGRLYPLSGLFYIAPNGRIGMGTTSPAGRLNIGAYQGGTSTSSVENFEKQLVLSGAYNVGTNGGNAVKLLISDYDNDTSDIYPIYVEDEQNRVDFYVRKEGQQASTFMDGAVGVNVAPNPAFTFRVANYGENNLSAARIETWDATSTESALSAFHFGQGEAILGSAASADGVRGIGVNGVHGTTSNLGGAGVLAESSAGVGLRVNATNPTNVFPAAQISNSGVGPSLQVLSSDPSSPLAAEFDGDLHVGLAGGLGVTEKVLLEINGSSAGEVRVRDSVGTETVVIQASESGGTGGAQIQLRDATGAATITMDASHSGSGRVLTEVLEITGGADLVESFESREDTIEAGTVVSADTENPGALRVSTDAYDRTVLGIVSGAGGVLPGLRLAQAGVLDGDTPVALSGRVYVKASTENGPIRAGDLLTSANLAGHAMRADDPGRTSGAVLGKALSNLDESTGLVLVLVSLQ